MSRVARNSITGSERKRILKEYNHLRVESGKSHADMARMFGMSFATYSAQLYHKKMYGAIRDKVLAFIARGKGDYDQDSNKRGGEHDAAE